MGRFLGKYADKAQFIMICLVTAGLVYASLSFVSTAYAAHYNATVTGYAFGLYGAAGVKLQQWHFANHPPGTMCGGQRDSSGDWPWGTRIHMDNSVMQHDAVNNAYYRSNFYLYDNGDPQCQKGLNWADLHFGRYYQWMWSSCCCPGTPNPVCEPGWNGVDNCQDAINFGSAVRGYTK
jgi:hypothetical protein